MKALTERNIRSGFKATGIWPVNGEKALEALKPKEKARRGFNQTTTPRKLPTVINIDWRTPQSSLDISQYLNTIRNDENSSIRDFRSLLQKAGRSLDQKNSPIQRLEEEKAILIAQKAAREPTGRVAVQFDPNKAFPNTEQLITAKDQAEKKVLHLTDENRRKPLKKKRKKSLTIEVAFPS
jgi:4-hydroxybenzoate polyprenyltransferase